MNQMHLYFAQFNIIYSISYIFKYIYPSKSCIFSLLDIFYYTVSKLVSQYFAECSTIVIIFISIIIYKQIHLLYLIKYHICSNRYSKQLLCRLSWYSHSSSTMIVSLKCQIYSSSYQDNTDSLESHETTITLLVQ